MTKLEARAIADALKIETAFRMIPSSYRLKTGILLILVQNSKCNTKQNFDKWVNPILHDISAKIADEEEKQKNGKKQ